MCGIAGYVDWKGSGNEGALVRMVERLHHRGPDDSGVWRSPDGICLMGHTRLSIIDLSPSGHQPMTDPFTGNTIVFNGEIYNFQALRAECKEKGDTFLSQTDTEVILALYRRHGTNCLQYLRGMFALAIWDPTKQQLFLARDRMGKKPLNYALSPDGMIFSSGIDALAHHDNVGRELDEDALELYLQLQYIPAPWTIYRSIRKLPPAHFAIFNRKGISIQQYWSVDYRKKVRIHEEDALDALDENLREAVKLRMIADVPIGALLSGGVDSSLVVALMATLNREPVKTFSIGFEENAFNELPYAKAVADQYRTDHETEVVRGEVVPLLSTIAKHYGEPFGDPSAVPSFHVCRMSRHSLKVALNGDGGDELLGGYPRYGLSPTRIFTGSVFGSIPSPEKLSELAGAFAGRGSFFFRCKRAGILQFVRPELQSFTMYYPYFNDEERRELHGQDGPMDDFVLRRWREDWLQKAMRAAANPIDRMLWMDNLTYLPGDLLVKMDIASMHCGLETRSPFLDHKVVEFCAALPVHLKVSGRTGKYLLKKLALRYLPQELVYRKKMGFGIPLSEWLKGPLKSVTQEILFNGSLMEPLDPSKIRERVSEFYNKGVDHSSRIWLLLMFGVWKKVCCQGEWVS